MSAAQSKRLGEYCRTIADQLWLRDWTVEIIRKWVNDDEDVMARCDPHATRDIVTIAVSTDFFELDKQVIRSTIAHELLHCHHARVSDIVKLDLLSELPQHIYSFMWSGFNRQIELMTDRLSCIVSPHLPLPSWGK